jgi:hypothetical protein
MAFTNPTFSRASLTRAVVSFSIPNFLVWRRKGNSRFSNGHGIIQRFPEKKSNFCAVHLMLIG